VSTRIQLRRDQSLTWEAVNPVLSTGEAGYEIDTGLFKMGDGINDWHTLPYALGTGEGGGPGPGEPSIPVRTSAVINTATMGVNTTDTGTLTMGKCWRLLKISANKACRVRLYATAAQRDADLARQPGVDPTGNHGLMFEYVATAGTLVSMMSPVVDGMNFEAPVTDQIPWSVTNLSAATSAIAVTLTYLRTE